jgi:poly(A) polymerase
VASTNRLVAIPSTIGPLAYRDGLASATDRLLLAADRPDAIASRLAELREWEEPRLPISGRDIIALGVPAGPEVSRLMLKVEADWIEAGFPDRDATLELARQALASSPDR